MENFAKKATLFVATLAMVLVAGFTTAAISGDFVAPSHLAEIPKGAKISATISGNTATVTLSGISGLSDVFFFGEDGPKNLGAVANFTIDLNQGNGFGFKISGKWALVYPEMLKSGKANRRDLFGPGIGLDCTDSRGCKFMVVDHEGKPAVPK